MFLPSDYQLMIDNCQRTKDGFSHLGCTWVFDEALTYGSIREPSNYMDQIEKAMDREIAFLRREGRFYLQ